MRYLVLGANGMAGHVIALVLLDAGHQVDGLARRQLEFVNTVVQDVKDISATEKLVREGNYDVVVNCIGILIDASERRPAEAAYVNSYLPLRLAEVLRHTSTRLIHLSTDCVFSGENGPYLDSDPYDGQRVYDRSKALGEIRNEKDLTLRTSIVGPELRLPGTGLFEWLMRQRGVIQGYSRVMWNGNTTVELANAIERMSSSSVSGVVHLVPNDFLSKFDLMSMLNNAFELGLTVERQPEYIIDKRLLASDGELPYRPQGYEAQIRELREWVLQRRDLYPQYDLLMEF